MLVLAQRRAARDRQRATGRVSPAGAAECAPPVAA
jgi:hypothetical protein